MSILWTLLLLILAALLLVGAVLHFLARMLLRPPRMTDGKALYVLRRMSPADLGMPFENVWFEAPAGPGGACIRLAGWWIDAASPSAQTAVLIHGFGDAKVGALAWASTWRDLGFNCLLIDLRAHGESGGTVTTGGVRERDDLDAVLNRLLLDRPAQAERLVLFGISLGGAVALACAAQREDVAAVVCDSTFADYAGAATAHGKLIGAPLPSLLPWAIRWAERQAGVRFAEARPTAMLARCRCPVMLIHGDADLFVPTDQVLALAEGLMARQNPLDDHTIVEDAPHVLSLAQDPIEYRARLAAFLNRLPVETNSRTESELP